MLYVLTGAPGAGKGTQADLLVKERGLKKLSTGDALRNQVKIGSDIGRQANEYMSKGLLVPDEILLGILKAEFAQAKGKDILLDGYPRNTTQAKTLKTLEKDYPVRAVIHLDVPTPELVTRLAGRRVCENCGASYHVDNSPTKVTGTCDNCGGRVVQRSDDQEDKVKVRLDVFSNETKPILEFYRKEGNFFIVNGQQSTNKVFADISAILDSLK